MDKKIRDHLNDKSDHLLLFKAKPNISLVEEVLTLNVSDLETIANEDLSKYIIVLSQYLIFFNSQMNKSRVLYKIYQKDFEQSVHTAIRDIKGKTVGERRTKALEGSIALQELEQQVDYYEREVELGKSHDSQVETLINALKRELTRRENENLYIRKERRM
jgi:hypothetical protein